MPAHCLGFKTRPGRIPAIGFVDGSIIRTHDRLGEVAPDMAGGFVFSLLFSKGILRAGPHVKGFGAEMFAECLVHDDINLSV